MSPVSYVVRDGIAVITIDSPPVNALSRAVRQGLLKAISTLADDANANAAVLQCAGRTFVAGADIAEFDAPLQAPTFEDVIGALEDSPKPIVAAIHGSALGGGLETAFGCHYRCAVPSARVGFPEVHLGLLPGAGGTQRLPRLVGVDKALDIILSGKPIAAAAAKELGIIDEIVEAELLDGAMGYARRLLDERAPPRRIRDLPVPQRAGLDELLAARRAEIARRARGFFAPQRIIDSVEAATALPFEQGLAREWALFEECRTGEQSKAQRHLFFAQRQVAKIPDVPKTTERRPVERIAVIGAGTMGGGIARACVRGGFPVTLVETDEENLHRGLESIRAGYASRVKRSKLTQADLEQRMALISGAVNYQAVSDADLVIEAVFERLDVKKEVFSRLDEVCKPGAILATNTSTLDVDAIAAATSRPADVIGLHFFAPANIMRLLEIVRGRETGKDVIATAFDFSRRLKKVGVLVGVCFGFVGNRMVLPYLREAQQLVLEGNSPERVDRVAYEWGMAMGPLAVMDLSGLDIFSHIVQALPERPGDPSYSWLVDELCALGRLGQKTGRGIYRYEGRKRIADPEVPDIAARAAEQFGVEPAEASDDEIIERLFYPMINEGAAILEEGIALRPGDIDVIWTNGFGFPAYRGGPMMYADLVGVTEVYDRLTGFAQRYGKSRFEPTRTLEHLAKEGASFSQWRP